MYFTSLPDHKDPLFDEQRHFALFREHNIVFNAAVYKSGCDDHVGCLSLKMVFEGEEWYKVGGVSYKVQPGRYMILNEGQNYGSAIRSETAVRSFSLFFKPQFASGVYRHLQTTLDSSLDDPTGEGPLPRFYQKLFTADARFLHHIRALLCRLDAEGYTSTGTDEGLLPILQTMILGLQPQLRSLHDVDAQKWSTRLEVFKRLNVARDVMHSFYAEPLQLEDISRYACLSVPQLVRQFKKAFGLSPHQYLTRIRLEEATRLLGVSYEQVSHVALACGFADASSFTRLFRQKLGTTPELYRRQSI